MHPLLKKNPGSAPATHAVTSTLCCLDVRGDRKIPCFGYRVIWDKKKLCYPVVSMPSRLHVSRCVFRQLIKTNLIKYKKAIVDIAPQWGAPYSRL